MTRSRTLTQMIADVRQRADLENSQHVSDTEITRYINQAIAGLHAMVVEQDEDEYAAEVTLSLAAGATTSNILTPPASPYKVLMVDYIDANGVSYPIRRFTLAERALLASTAITGGQTSYYRLRGLNTLLLSPPLAVASTVRVTYIEASADLVTGTDVYDGRDGWEEWVTLDAAIRCAIKEESDQSDLVRERAMVEARIKAQMQARDRAEPERMRDVKPWIVDEW